MKRNLIVATLVIFAFSSVFLLSSCAKKKLVAEEKEVTAAPKEEAKVEEEKPAEVEVAKEAKEPEEKKVEEVRVEKPEVLEEAKKEAVEEKVWEDTRGLRFEAEAIYFDFDKSFIRAEYRPVLAKKAEFLKDNPDIIVRIEGNCDERGTNEYNLALGERRADSAKRFFISLGISPDRIETISYGEERPLAVGHSEDSWSQNRRDDFVIVKK